MPRLLLALPLLVTVLGACGLIMSQDDQKKVAAACQGEPVEGAKAHEKGPEGFLVYVQNEAEGAYAWSVDGVHYKLRDTTKIPEVNTVFCLDAPVEVPQGTCVFDTTQGLGVAGVQVVETSRSSGPSFPRVGVRRSARLVDPATGATIAEHTVTVDAPGCDAYVGDPVADFFVAKPPTGISFADWATGELGVETK